MKYGHGILPRVKDLVAIALQKSCSSAYSCGRVEIFGSELASKWGFGVPGELQDSQLLEPYLKIIYPDSASQGVVKGMKLTVAINSKSR